MYNKFHEKFPTCTLRFTYNHCRRRQSRKQNMPFWCGKAVCRTGSCVSVEMTIEDEPTDDEDVQVNVVVRGRCMHMTHDGSDDEFDS